MSDVNNKIFKIDILGNEHILKIEHINTEKEEGIIDFVMEVNCNDEMIVFTTNVACEYDCYNRLISSLEHMPKFHYSFEEKNNELILTCKNDYVKTPDTFELKKKVFDSNEKIDKILRDNIHIAKLVNDLREEHVALHKQFATYKSASEKIIDTLVRRVSALERK